MTSRWLVVFCDAVVVCLWLICADAIGVLLWATLDAERRRDHVGFSPALAMAFSIAVAIAAIMVVGTIRYVRLRLRMERG